MIFANIYKMYGEDNPDARLVKIMAANEGFQSKMSSETGSYVMTSFIQGLSDNIYDNENDKFLKDILEEIQHSLHDGGKQLMEYTFNNKTDFIKFYKNDKVLGESQRGSFVQEEALEMIALSNDEIDVVDDDEKP